MPSAVRVALAPRWWAWHLALVAVLASFGWLGWWQLGHFRSEAPRVTAAPVRPLDAVTEPGGRLDSGDVGRRVRARGTWEPSGQLLVPGRERSGRDGLLVVTPLRTGSGVLPVVRGWVAEPASAPVPPPGEVTVTGVVQRNETDADATAVAGALPRDQVPYVAAVTLLSALPYPSAQLYDGFVVLTSQQPPDANAPARVSPRETAAPSGGAGRWRNLAYGLQWWVFAGAAVLFWALVLRRAAQQPGAHAAARAGRGVPPRTT